MAVDHLHRQKSTTHPTSYCKCVFDYVRPRPHLIRLLFYPCQKSSKSLSCWLIFLLHKIYSYSVLSIYFLASCHVAHQTSHLQLQPSCNSRRFDPSSLFRPLVFDDLGSSIHACKMHKISNITGQARHGWERMAPAGFGGMSRVQQDVSTPQPLRRPQPSPGTAPQASSESTPVHLSFNIPFSYNLPGPEREEVLHSSPGALQRWTFPPNTDDGSPIHKLPVHIQNEERLRTLCQYLSDQTGGRIRATVTSSEPKTGPALHRKSQSLVTNVCVSGDGDLAPKIRARILNETPIMMV